MKPDVMLVTERTWQAFGDDVLAIAPAVRPLIMARDGSLSLDGSPVSFDDADADVAWMTADLFGAGAPLRPFFGLVRRLPGLQWVQSPAAGTDESIWPRLLERGVRVTNAHVAYVAISEYVLRAVLDHYQQAERWRAAQRDSAWRRHDFREVAGSHWLIVGLGSIGTAVAVRASAFGASVVGIRRRPNGDEPVERVVTPDRTLAELGEADVVVLCAPATDETNKLVDAEFLAAMKPRSVLVNIARGALVDEPALLAALDAGVPEAALLDVTEVEPLPADSPLWTHPRVTITPHNSGGGLGRYQRLADVFCDNLRRYLDDRPLVNELTPDQLD